MATDISHLEPEIRQILSAPGTDLSTISAKRVRRQLLDLDSSLTSVFLKEHKDAIDALIASVFEQVSAEQGANGGDEEELSSTHDGSRSSRKRHHDQNEGEDNEDEEASPPAKKPRKPSKNGQKLSDEELARKLSNEINGRTTRTGGKGRGTKGRAKKSAATVKSDNESDEDEDGKKKPKKKRAGGGSAKGGFAKEFALSEPLSVVLQAEKMSRPQVVKQLWVYIKENNLQNPRNKREIMCDPNLKAVFAVDKIDMFKMNKVLGQHLHDSES